MARKPAKRLNHKERRAALPANLRRIRRGTLLEARKADETPEEQDIREARQIRRGNKPSSVRRKRLRTAVREYKLEEKDQVLRANSELFEDWISHIHQFPANDQFSPEAALAYINSSPSTPTRKTYWCDGSVKKHAGIGVAYKDDSGDWTKLTWRVQNPPIMQEELAKASAIAKAFEVAREDYDLLVEKPRQVVIFSDSPTALTCFANLRHESRFYNILLDPGFIAAKELGERGVQIELRYVPNLRGRCITGNRQARHAANWRWRDELEVPKNDGLFPVIHPLKEGHEGRKSAAC